ncbi:MAG: hypothetical protein ABI907_06490 [Ramlibacter sp.]
MNKLPVFLTALLAGGACLAQDPIQPVRLVDWRSLIQQANAKGIAAPRRLSAEERAVLRRQVQQTHPKGK